MMPASRLAALTCLAALINAAPPASIKQSPAKPAVSQSTLTLPAPLKDALLSIQAAALKGDLSFLASDAFKGRFTPSPELDIAAEFIAAQFRSAGLEPGVGGSYFQVAPMVDRLLPGPESAMTVTTGSQSFTIAPESITIFSSPERRTLDRCAVVLFRSKDAEALGRTDVRGKIVMAPAFNRKGIPADKIMAAFSKSQDFDRAVNHSGAKAEILIGRTRRGGKMLLSKEEVADVEVPIVIVENEQLAHWLQEDSPADAHAVSLIIPGPDDVPVEPKNVVGILRGSDPKLRNTYVILTAHYDHIGTRQTGASLSNPLPKDSVDQIFNGANDDGSGTVSVIEIARSLARLKVHPKRSIVFMTFFGEERGDIGSRFYVNHPLLPIPDTIADVNLEQIGRTDATEGPHVNAMAMTGFDYSNIASYFVAAGKLMGTTMYVDQEASDQYFERSDNAALAAKGVPAHTLCVAFDYPDYHGLADEWQKIDYENMARIDRTIALSLVQIANDAAPPHWISSNPKTASFREARANLKKQ